MFMAVENQDPDVTDDNVSYMELQEAYEQAKKRYNEEIFPDAFGKDETFEELDDPARYAKIQMWGLPELKEQEEEAVEAAEQANKYMEKLSQLGGESESSRQGNC